MANIMNNPRLAIIGTGNIANFHCDAFKQAGFDISHAAGSKNSKNILPFSEKHLIQNIYMDPLDVLKKHDEWDIILLSTPTEYNFDYLDSIIELQKPALIEKPVAIDPQYLSRFKKNDHAQVRVAYNRRFYSTIQNAKKFISDEGAVHARIELPEMVNEIGNYNGVLLNSAHGIDLLLYLFEDIHLHDVYHYKNDAGRMAIFKSNCGTIINLTMNWNSPSNFMINIESGTKRLEIKPFEYSKVFQGMQVIEPSDDLPSRRYIPQEVDNTSSYPVKNQLVKPGFLEQALEMKNIFKGKGAGKSASLYDAFKVQKILKEILD
tara:strand:- start:235 stop:1194 length:960 start_codon:yes stop_codon:yes gene_type:complete